MFTEKLNDILSQISHMPCYIIGDYNIDLLKHDSHLQTEQFLDVMHSNSLPKPSVRSTGVYLRAIFKETPQALITKLACNLLI